MRTLPWESLRTFLWASLRTFFALSTVAHFTLDIVARFVLDRCALCVGSPSPFVHSLVSILVLVANLCGLYSPNTELAELVLRRPMTRGTCYVCHVSYFSSGVREIPGSPCFSGSAPLGQVYLLAGHWRAILAPPLGPPLGAFGTQSQCVIPRSRHHRLSDEVMRPGVKAPGAGAKAVSRKLWTGGFQIRRNTF